MLHSVSLDYLCTRPNLSQTDLILGEVLAYPLVFQLHTQRLLLILCPPLILSPHLSVRISLPVRMSCVTCYCNAADCIAWFKAWMDTGKCNGSSKKPQSKCICKVCALSPHPLNVLTKGRERRAQLGKHPLKGSACLERQCARIKVVAACWHRWSVAEDCRRLFLTDFISSSFIHILLYLVLDVSVSSKSTTT